MKGADVEVWPAGTVDGLNRVRSLLQDLVKEGGRFVYAPVTDPIRGMLSALFLNAQLAGEVIELWRAEQPCKIWGFDGYLRCSIHGAHWAEKDDNGSDDCPKRRNPSPEQPTTDISGKK